MDTKTAQEKTVLEEMQEQYAHPKRKKRIKKIEKKRSIKSIMAIVLMTLAVIIYGAICAGEQYAKWRTYNEWQFPAKWIGLIKRLERATVNRIVVEDKKEMSKQEIVDASRHPEEISIFWKLESGKGTNDNPEALHNYCKSKGETNEFGYGGMQSMICFKTFQESVDRVSQWLDERDAEMYCYYATGKRTNDCYYMDRVNLEKLN
jgi:hypothetical protein